MELLAKCPRGTRDILPEDSYKWRFLESIMLNEAELYGFSEIRTPVFEHTELFNRIVGEDTDIVQKEMYTFKDKGGRSITLRPEGTAGAARAILEHGLHNETLPIKVSYLTSCYRYEKPQSGRYREFHQFGVESFGTQSPAEDAEIICMADSLFNRLGIKNLTLEINSIGCKKCRKEYYKALKEYLKENIDKLCETCKKRYETNPMRIIDCKNPECKDIVKEAPNVIDFICDECREHFNLLKDYLEVVGVKYEINPRIVRGLDYYTKTVFEFVSKDEKTEGLVCGGGGRYDGLIEELSGKSMPSIGFGIGIERIMLILDSQGIEFPNTSKCDLYIATLDKDSSKMALKLCKELREAGFMSSFDVVGRSLKAQMKYADKIEASFSMVLGESELKTNVARIKDMTTGKDYKINLGENFLSEFFEIKSNIELELHKNLTKNRT